jgi:hypothetical protein
MKNKLMKTKVMKTKVEKDECVAGRRKKKKVMN